MKNIHSVPYTLKNWFPQFWWHLVSAIQTAFWGPSCSGWGFCEAKGTSKPNHSRILWYCGSEVVFLAYQKILNRNNRYFNPLEEENIEMTHGLQEQFVFWSWVLGGKKIKLFSWLAFFKWMWKKGRQILTPLQRKIHTEAKQQNLSQLYTVKYCVQLVHSWAHVLGLVYFLLPLHSYLCAFKYRRRATPSLSLCFAFPLALLTWQTKSAENETIIVFTE